MFVPYQCQYHELFEIEDAKKEFCHWSLKLALCEKKKKRQMRKCPKRTQITKNAKMPNTADAKWGGGEGERKNKRKV